MAVWGWAAAGPGRAAATALGKLTWVFAAAFIATSITLTVLAAQTASTASVIDQIGGTVPTPVAPEVPALGGNLLPPAPTDAPAAPPKAD